MQLKTLIANLETVRVDGSSDREIAGIAYDSRRVKPGFLFVALRGEKADGHEFISKAIEQGAIAVLCEKSSGNLKATSVVVKDTRAAMATVAAAFFKNPSHHLKMAGVTGTNGKTTTTFLIKHICDNAFWR